MTTETLGSLFLSKLVNNQNEGKKEYLLQMLNWSKGWLSYQYHPDKNIKWIVRNLKPGFETDELHMKKEYEKQ